jgi:transposase-like protein
MSEINEFGSFAKEVSILLDINTNTLRRWSIELEKQGYEFERNEKEQRIYYKRDIIALKQMQQLISEKTSVLNASKQVSKRYINKKELEQTLSVQEKNSVQITLSKEELQHLIEGSVEKAIEKEREAMFSFFEKKLNNQIELRDRQLMQELTKKQLEIAATNEENKKGFFSRLFKK